MTTAPITAPRLTRHPWKYLFFIFGFYSFSQFFFLNSSSSSAAPLEKVWFMHFVQNYVQPTCCLCYRATARRCLAHGWTMVEHACAGAQMIPPSTMHAVGEIVGSDFLIKTLKALHTVSMKVGCAETAREKENEK